MRSDVVFKNFRKTEIVPVDFSELINLAKSFGKTFYISRQSILEMKPSLVVRIKCVDCPPLPNLANPLKGYPVHLYSAQSTYIPPSPLIFHPAISSHYMSLALMV